MEWLNYHHLHCFWAVAREGSLVAAGRLLHVSHPTLSAQVHALEAAIGEKLLTKVGRRLELTDAGRVVFRYANDIFALGQEMLHSVRGRTAGKGATLNIGTVDALPKLVVKRLLSPITDMTDAPRLVCREDNLQQLLADLATHALDIVLADAPVPVGGPVRAFSHLLSESPVGFFATRHVREKYGSAFPQNLDQAPLLLPLEGSSLRRSLNAWFAKKRLSPRVAAEFEDSALMKVFGADGAGFFPAPLAMRDEVCRQFHVEWVGEAEGVVEHFYAVSIERRITHPAVVVMRNAARLWD